MAPSEHKQYAIDLLTDLSVDQPEIKDLNFDADRAQVRNAAKAMTAILCHRLLKKSKHNPIHKANTTYEWKEGIFNSRNIADRDYMWTNIRRNLADEIHKIGQSKPAVYLLACWKPTDTMINVWAIPEPILHDSLSSLLFEEKGQKYTLQIKTEKQRIERFDASPDLTPYYRRIQLAGQELLILKESREADASAKKERETAHGEGTSDVDDGEGDSLLGFTTATVKFVKELPSHTTDGEWHENNKQDYRRLLRNPCQTLVDELQRRYGSSLNPEVFGVAEPLFRLRIGGRATRYRDHFGFAFYDPEAPNRESSPSLFFRIDGSPPQCRYGYKVGEYCRVYFEDFLAAVTQANKDVKLHLERAPKDVTIHISLADQAPYALAHFSEFVEAINKGGSPQQILFQVAFPLEELPDHDDRLIDEVGEFFRWVWPFFLAATSKEWTTSTAISSASAQATNLDVDEDAPLSLEQLAEQTCLTLSFLTDIEDALLAKHQLVLVGPPGTSKTYIARQFARYFVRQRPGQPQGIWDILYMHSSWTYEDFFEGIRPLLDSEQIKFQPHRGVLLRWVQDRLHGRDTTARHVLVLDEINRCDTAAVMGELLQLLEYRGKTINLLSGRPFLFPDNLYVVGTMNSADRSIGRMDLALRRRFFWLDLHPCSEVLDNWLRRPGNNPIGFRADTLQACNKLLQDHGFPPEQHIGHALFMLNQADASGSARDVPLTEKHLKQIVQFSVLPYVRELLLTQFGRLETDIIAQIRAMLLMCVNNPSAVPKAGGESNHA